MIVVWTQPGQWADQHPLLGKCGPFLSEDPREEIFQKKIGPAAVLVMSLICYCSIATVACIW